MGSEAWKIELNNIGDIFPLKTDPDEPFPELAVALDDGVEDLLQNSLADDKRAVNPLYVEDLLRDCMSRITNCLTLREKAQDIEVRAISDALSYRMQVASMAFQATSDELLKSYNRLMLTNAVGATVDNDKITPTGVPEEIWKKLTEAQELLMTSARTTLETRKNKALQPGNGSNYAERFQFIKNLFDLNIVEVYRRSLMCAKALKDIYGITAHVPEPKENGFLDAMTIWAQRASDDLDLELDERQVGNAIFAVAAHDEVVSSLWLMPRSTYSAQLGGQALTFDLKSQHFEDLKMQDVRLRSVRLQGKPKADDLKPRLWRTVLTLPKAPVTDANDSFALAMPSTFQDLADGESVVRGVHNISPIGEWRMRFDKASVNGDDVNEANLFNVYLMLRVSYKAM